MERNEEGYLQALRVPVVLLRASRAAHAGGRASPAITAALFPFARNVRRGGLGRRDGAGALGRGAGGSSRRRSSRRLGRASSQSLKQTGVGRLLVQVLIPGQSGALAGESAGNPGVLVGPVPDGESHTLGGLDTGLDQVLEVGRLLGKLRVGGGSRHANVDLGVGHFDAERGVGFQGAGQVVLAGGVSNREVALETNTVDLDAVRLDQLDNLQGARGLVASPFNVVIVVVELHVGVGGGSGGKGNRKIGFTDGLVEDVLAVGAILIER